MVKFCELMLCVAVILAEIAEQCGIPVAVIPKNIHAITNSRSILIQLNIRFKRCVFITNSKYLHPIRQEMIPKPYNFF